MTSKCREQIAFYYFCWEFHWKYFEQIIFDARWGTLSRLVFTPLRPTLVEVFPSDWAFQPQKSIFYLKQRFFAPSLRKTSTKVGLRGVNTNLERVSPPGLKTNLSKVFPMKFSAKNNKKRISLGILKSSRKIDFFGAFQPKSPYFA